MIAVYMGKVDQASVHDVKAVEPPPLVNDEAAGAVLQGGARG
jgi:hypothetical protein